MACPKWEQCDKSKCRDERTCLNGDFWTKYWGSEATARRMSEITVDRVSKNKRYKSDWTGVCLYCQRKLGDKLISTRDHIIPVSHGGSNDKRNLVESCARCNGIKANRTPDQFAIWLGYEIDDKRKRISKDTLILILCNTRQLILKIAPYRHELYKYLQPKMPVECKAIEIPPQPKLYPKSSPSKKIVAYENGAEKWWYEWYLPNCHPNPDIFLEK